MKELLDKQCKVTFYRDMFGFLVALVVYEIFLIDFVIYLWEALFLLFLCAAYIISIILINKIHTREVLELNGG